MWKLLHYYPSLKKYVIKNTKDGTVKHMSPRLFKLLLKLKSNKVKEGGT